MSNLTVTFSFNENITTPSYISYIKKQIVNIVLRLTYFWAFGIDNIWGWSTSNTARKPKEISCFISIVRPCVSLCSSLCCELLSLCKHSEIWPNLSNLSLLLIDVLLLCHCLLTTTATPCRWWQRDNAPTMHSVPDKWHSQCISLKMSLHTSLLISITLSAVLFQ
jgi:hypothetical protein